MPLIAIEGPDGSGKSTLANNLVNNLNLQLDEAELKEKKWVAVTDPSIGDVGRLIRKFMKEGGPRQLDALGYLFMADRLNAFPTEQEMPRVITDRYMLSTLVYQSMWMPKHVLAAVLADPRIRRPDVTIVLTLSGDDCLDRLAKRERDPEVFEDPEFVYKMSAAYHAVALGRHPDDLTCLEMLRHDPNLQHLAAGRIIPLDVTGLNKGQTAQICLQLLKPWL